MCDCDTRFVAAPWTCRVARATTSTRGPCGERQWRASWRTRCSVQQQLLVEPAGYSAAESRERNTLVSDHRLDAHLVKKPRRHDAVVGEPELDYPVDRLV